MTRRGFVAGAAVAGATLAAGVARAAETEETAETETAPEAAEEAETAPAEASQALECDVVIAGAGAAGLWAGIEAVDAGLNVIVIDKASSVAMANGAQAGGPLAVGSKIQQEIGDGFDVEIAFNSIMDWAHWSINAPVVKAALEISGNTVDRFTDDFGIKMVVLPDSYHAGYQVRCSFSADGVTPYSVSGEDRFMPLVNWIEDKGGQVLMNTPMTGLIVEDGAVTGLRATDADGNEIQIKAKATCVCTGGFQGNADMMFEKFGTQVMPLGNTLSDGTGINSMVEAGAALDTHWGIAGNEFACSTPKDPWSFGNPNACASIGIMGGLLVNSHGRRFTNEGKYAEFPLAVGGTISLEVGGTFYGVYDQTYMETVASQSTQDLEADIQRAIDNGWGFKADSIAELASMIDAPELEATVERYNGFADAGEDTDYYKDASLLSPVADGPFYAFEYAPSCWVTMGGVKTNDRLQVIDNMGTPIKGLYCAGVDNGTILMVPYHCYEGTSLGMAFSTGRLAGRYIAEDLSA